MFRFNPLTPVSPEEKLDEEKSSKMPGNSKGKAYFIILLLLGLWYYKDINKKADVLVETTANFTLLEDLDWFIQLCWSRLHYFYQCIMHMISTIVQLFYQVDFHYYYTCYMDFYNEMPVIAITALSIISIVSITVLLFGVYAFCKFFLFISDSSSEKVNLDHETASIHQRKIIKEFAS